MATLKTSRWVEPEPKVNSLDLREYTHFANSELLKILKCIPKLGERGPWVAGGSVWRTINNEPLTNCDVDIFFTSKKHYEEGCMAMIGYPYVNNILNEKKNKWSTTYTVHVNEGKFNKIIDIQFIGTFFHKTLPKLLDSFDFSVCQFGYDGSNMISGLYSVQDLQQRKIRLLTLTHPKTFLKHLSKYLNNGFTIQSDETRKAAALMLDLNVWSKTASKSNTVDYNENDEQNTVAVENTDAPIQEHRRTAWNTDWTTITTENVRPTDRLTEELQRRFQNLPVGVDTTVIPDVPFMEPPTARPTPVADGLTEEIRRRFQNLAMRENVDRTVAGTEEIRPTPEPARNETGNGVYYANMQDRNITTDYTQQQINNIINNNNPEPNVTRVDANYYTAVNMTIPTNAVYEAETLRQILQRNINI